jgi:hypothetical protein
VEAPKPSDTAIRFEVEILDEQRQLSGSRYVSLEGVSLGEGAKSNLWTISLSFAQTLDGDVQEGDLTLVSAFGSIFAGLDSGNCDSVPDETQDERDEIELSMRVVGGEGDFAGLEGTVSVQGAFRVDGGELLVRFAR